MAAKNLFDIPFAGIDKVGNYDLLIGLHGEHSVILKLINPVVRYAANPKTYDEFHLALNNLIKMLGDGHLIQKLDVIDRTPFKAPQATEYLQQKYNEHFNGRECLRVSTYLVITKRVKTGSFYTYDARALQDFLQRIGKALDILPAAKPLSESEINLLMIRILSMDFGEGSLVLDNILPGDTEIKIGNKLVRSLALVDTDSIDLPPDVGTHIELNEKDSLRGFPVDFLSFLFRIPGCDVVVFNQVIDIPGQLATLRKLEQKKKRHSGIPDPANQLCVEDIDHLLTDVARQNQLLVQCHFNIVLVAEGEALQKATNFVESSLFQLGIILSKNAYNQLELFRSVLPGNTVELKTYDWFLTTADAALCFFFKESLPQDDPSDFLIRFTDRQGIPVAIDLADLPMRNGRINNRNKFVLGGSGTGKSFLMCSILEQYCLYNMDVVIVDVGHSYSGLCKYYGGKYITYTDEKPITMNPFALSKDEYNIEKKDFLITLIALLWKGSEGALTAVERDVLSHVINAFYAATFQDEQSILNFNTFYEFALKKLPVIKQEESIPFDLEEFRYVLKKFYKGGEYESILNEPADESLFTERFIVYEIDNVQNNPILFPIVTLIIMDVFIQKMRNRKNQRKALILEEAWRALASPVMANFLLYLNKTVRKFWGEIIEVTQEIGDIIGNPIVKDSIINNSDTVILLDQSNNMENFHEIAPLLSINEVERKKIFTINKLNNKEGRGRFKEVYIRRGAEGEVYGVEVSLHQYLTYTTEKPEKIAVESYTRLFGSYTDGLDAFVDDYNKSGLPLPAFIQQVNKQIT